MKKYIKHILFSLLFVLHIFVCYTNNIITVIAIDDDSRDTLRGVTILLREQKIAESNYNGEIDIDITDLNKSEKLEFEALGYGTVVIPTNDLRNNAAIEMSLKTLFIDEVTITSTSKDFEALFNKLINANSKRHKSKKNYTRYMASGHYAKLVEANDYTIMSRDEYGLYFTSGTTKRKDRFDTSNLSNFIAQYGARSYDLTSDGNEQMDNMYLYGSNLSTLFDANSVNVFYVMRHLALYGPIVSGDDNFKYELLGYDDNIGTIQFESIEDNYPNQTPLIAVGKLHFDRETLRVVDINIERMYLVNQTVIDPAKEFDFEYSAHLKVDYDLDGVFYFKSCDLTLKWSSIDVVGARYLLKPARPYPHRNKLVEKEYWRSEELKIVDEELQSTKNIWYVLGLASRIGCGVYNRDFFQGKEFPIESSDNFAKLNTFCPLDSMYIETSLSSRRYNAMTDDKYNQAVKCKKMILDRYSAGAII